MHLLVELHELLHQRYVDLCQVYNVIPQDRILSSCYLASSCIAHHRPAILPCEIRDLGQQDLLPLIALLSCSSQELSAIDVDGEEAAAMPETILQLLAAAGSSLRSVNLTSKKMGWQNLRDLLATGLPCQTLNLSFTNLRYIPITGAFTNLHTLYLDCNPNVTHIPESCFQNSPRLANLSLCGTSITNLWMTASALAQIPALSELRFQQCPCCPRSTATCPDSLPGGKFGSSRALRMGEGLAENFEEFGEGFMGQEPVGVGVQTLGSPEQGQGLQRAGSMTYFGSFLEEADDEDGVTGDEPQSRSPMLETGRDLELEEFQGSIPRGSPSGTGMWGDGDVPYRNLSPICRDGNYRIHLLTVLPRLRVLDNVMITELEREGARLACADKFEWFANGRQRRENIASLVQRRESGSQLYRKSAPPGRIWVAEGSGTQELRCEVSSINGIFQELILSLPEDHQSPSISYAPGLTPDELSTACSLSPYPHAPVDKLLGMGGPGSHRHCENSTGFKRSLASSRVDGSQWPEIQPAPVYYYKGVDVRRRFRPRQFEYNPLEPHIMVMGTLQGEIIVWNHESGFVIGQIQSIGAPNSMLGLSWFNKDPSKLVGGNENGSIQLYDVSHMRTRHLAFMRRIDQDHNSFRIPPPQFSDPAVRTYDEFEQLTSVHVNCVDGLLVASGYTTDIGLYDLKAGRTIQVFQNLHGEHINVVKFSHHSPHLFASCSFDRTVKMWDLRENICSSGPILSTRSDNCNVMVCFSPDDRYLLASAVDNEVRQYCASDGRLQLQLSLRQTMSSNNFTRSYYMNGGDYIITGSCEENVVRISCARTGRLLRDVVFESKLLRAPESKTSPFIQSLRGHPEKDFHFSALVTHHHPTSRSEIVKVNLMSRNFPKNADQDVPPVMPAGMGA